MSQKIKNSAADTGAENTELRRKEALLKTGALQSAIFNSANFSSIATDAKGVIQIFNVGAERMLGYAAADVVNKITPADISDPQEVIGRAEALSAEFDTPIAPGFEALVFKASRGIEDIYELTYIRKDGSRFPAVVSVTALRDPDDSIIGYLLIGTDNTARKQIEAEQKQLGQRLRDHQFYTRSLFESNIDALMTIDSFGIVTDVNKQMETLTGCTREELIGAPFKKHFTDPQRAEAGILQVLKTQRVTNYELTARSRDGKETVVSYNAVTLYDRSRKLQGVFAAARDVTERKQIEEELKRSNADLEQFSYAVSHDLRQPLRMISSYLKLLDSELADQLDPEQRVYLNFACGGAKRLDQMMVGLLEYSRVGRKGEPHTWVESRSVLDEALFFLQPAIAEAHTQIHIQGDWPRVFVSPDEILRLLQNLIGNALKFRVAGRTPEISVTSEIVGKEWRASIADNGAGINPNQIGRLFQVFQRLQSRADYEGNGIGLALCRKITEHHGGRIWAESAGEGQGSRFCIALPLEGLGKIA